MEIIDDKKIISEIISFKKFEIFGKTKKKLFVDLKTVPKNRKFDYRIRNYNIINGHELCIKCDGTGNSTYHKYTPCGNCMATGSMQNILDFKKEFPGLL